MHREHLFPDLALAGTYVAASKAHVERATAPAEWRVELRPVAIAIERGKPQLAGDADDVEAAPSLPAREGSADRIRSRPEGGREPLADHGVRVPVPGLQRPASHNRNAVEREK